MYLTFEKSRNPLHYMLSCSIIIYVIKRYTRCGRAKASSLEVFTMTNTNTDKVRDLVLERMLKAGWLNANGCTVLDKDGKPVKA